MFHGSRVSEHISKKLHTVVWTKTQTDVQYLNNPIDDKHLEALAELVAVASPQGLSSPKSAARLAVHKMRQAFEKLGGPKEQENVALIKAAVDRVVDSLDSLTEVPIDRIYLVASSPRRDALKDCDIDLVVFLKSLENEEKLKSTLLENFNIISSQVLVGETSFFFTVGVADLCVSYTPSIHSQSALQREAILNKLTNKDKGLGASAGNLLKASDDHEKALYSTACSESLPEFYQRYLKSSESEFYVNIARLVKLWKHRNIPNVHMNPLLLVLLGLRIAEHHVAVSGDQNPSATAVFQELMETLKTPENISVFFDTFGVNKPSDLAQTLEKRPAVVDPTNYFNNLAESVDDWAAVKEAAIVSLENMKSRRSLASLFPPVPVVRVTSPTIVRAAKGA